MKLLVLVISMLTVYGCQKADYENELEKYDVMQGIDASTAGSEGASKELTEKYIIKPSKD